MDKNNEWKNNKTSESKQKQDNLKPWLKLLPAAAVFAAVCVTCYHTEKSPVETTAVSDNNIMSTEDIKELISTGNISDKPSQYSSAKENKTTKKKASKIKTGIKKNTTTGAVANGSAAGSGGAGSTVTPTTSVPADGYVDGTYMGSGTGFGGTITVQVTVSDHKIASINILDASSETASYFANAQGVISRIISSQSPNVDAVSGATYSSNGIITAVQNALSQAIPSGNQTTDTPTPTPSPKPTKKPVPAPDPDKELPYKDGTYTGTAKGYSGTVTLTAKIKNGIIKSLDVKHTDTPQFFQKAWDVLENAIIQNQSADGIDTVSGATYSSKGILNAMKDIQKQAARTNAKVTPTPVPTETPKVTPTPEATPTPEVTPTPEATPIPEATPTPDKNPVMWKNNLFSNKKKSGKNMKILKRRINYMMKEKKKGLLQRGIMVAVSALTIVAGAGTVLAYEPMQSSDSSFEEIMLDFEPEKAEFNIQDIIENLDFSKSNTIFIYEDGTQIPIQDKVISHALCTHSMVNGYFTAHKSNGSGGCTVKVYKCQRCEKCGYLANAVLYSTTTYPKCPH